MRSFGVSLRSSVPNKILLSHSALGIADPFQSEQREPMLADPVVPHLLHGLGKDVEKMG